MEAIEQLKEDVRCGRIDPERLVDLLASLQQQLLAARQRIAHLEEQLGNSSNTPNPSLPYSVDAEEKRQQARSNKRRKRKDKGRRGRVRTADKIALAHRTEDVYPHSLDPDHCWLSHTRVVWRLENGRAVLVAYRIYRGPNNRYGLIPGVLGRSEFGLEIVAAIAFQVYVVGLSFDKVVLLLAFFQDLKLSKQQVDALLHQLARHWHKQFDALCTLLANSLLVHADETSWSLNSVWALLSEKARLLLFGVHKDAATLQTLLDPATFSGIVISDDAAVYGHFTKAQKCWAHLLRKAIKLTLQDPDNPDYRQFTDRLLEIYRSACRVQRDGRLSDCGRAAKVAGLEDELAELCGLYWLDKDRPREGLGHDFQLLINELLRLLLADELFTFVTARAVEQPNGQTHRVAGTNNEAERTLRNPAMARKTGRTNKTIAGARRQTIVVSVLESLKLYLGRFTLASVIEEVQGWVSAGRSCFEEMLGKLGLAQADESILEQIVAQPSG
jgi:hypothetical protein